VISGNHTKFCAAREIIDKLEKGVEKQIAAANRHIERYWATLRARITRYVRKSLSFSRKLKYHHLVTKLFMVNYNQECINTF
jgi:IS1 family transposase